MPSAAFQPSLPLTTRSTFNAPISQRRPRCPFSVHPKPSYISVHPRACKGIPVPPPNLDSLVSQVAKSIDNAITDGHTRLQITALIPGLNPQVENTAPYNEALLHKLSIQLILSSQKLSLSPVNSLLFKSAGTAAAALNQFRKYETLLIPENINIASYFGRDAPVGKSRIGDANIIVNPVSARGNPVFSDLQSLIAEREDAIWILINPDFTSDRAALGMRDIELRELFLASFTSVFYFRNLFEVQRPRLNAVERGALLHVYPGKYHLFYLANSGYVHMSSSESIPSPNEITTIVQKAQQMNAKPTSSQVGVDEDSLQIIVACALTAATVYIAMKIGPGIAKSLETMSFLWLFHE